MARTLIVAHCPPQPPWSGERRVVEAARAFFANRSDVDVEIVERTQSITRRVANKSRVPLAPPYAARFETRFDRWEDYDTIWVYEVWAMSCVPRRVAPRVLWDKDTLMGDSFLQQADSRVRALTARWIRRYERGLLRRVRWSFLSNSEEVATLAAPRVSVLPHGIEHIVPRTPGWLTPQDLTFGFTGVLGYAPNRNGIVDFVLNEYPAARAAATQAGRRARLLIAGPDLAEADRVLLTSHPDVTVLGYVEHIGDFYRQIDVALAPMTQGAGSATKVMEALSHGVPVIGTPTGLRGLDARLHGWVVPRPAHTAWSETLDRAGSLVRRGREPLANILVDFRSEAIFEQVVGPLLDQ